MCCPAAMPPERALEAPLGGVGLTGLSGAWRSALARFGAAWTALILLFLLEWRAMADQWWNISTYSHVLLVPAIVAWLVYLRAPQVLRLSPLCWAPGLGLLAGALLLWVLGAVAGFAEASEAGAVAMLMVCVPLLLGPRVATALLFPMAYMAFLVPFGDELIPALQTLDARITVALVHLSRVPASIDGVFISTPAGLFEIAEACSGVKFLIAMVAFGVLASNVCFVSWRRRVVFMAMAIVVPILANGVRSWGTIYVAQFKGAAWAGGFDHIVYGWIFFALVIGGILAGAWRYFDRPVDEPMVDVEALLASPRLARMERAVLAPWLALAATLALVLAAQGWARLAGRLEAPMPARIDLPQVPGWQRAPYAPRVWWQPRASGAAHRLLGRYEDGAGHRVDVFFALYPAQGPGRKAGGFGEGALTPGGPWAWQGPGGTMPQAHGDRLLAAGPVARLAETTYRTGALTTGSNLALKLANIRDKLLLRRRSTMLLILSAEEGGGQSAGPAITAFRRAIGPVDRWMDGVARGN